MARPRKYAVTFTEEDRPFLQALLRQGTAQARVLTRARILLWVAAGRSHPFLAAALQGSPATVPNIGTRVVPEGVAGALDERPRPGAKPKLDERGVAPRSALAGSAPPDGREQWTM